MRLLITCALTRLTVKSCLLTSLNTTVGIGNLLWGGGGGGGAFIERVPCFKLLGVHVSDDLTWAAHRDATIKKVNRRLYGLLVKIWKAKETCLPMANGQNKWPNLKFNWPKLMAKFSLKQLF